MRARRSPSTRSLLFGVALALPVAASAQPASKVDAPAPASKVDAPAPVVLKAANQTFTFRVVPPGVFEQGSPPTEAGRGDDETPRTVRLMEPFALLSTPVTRGQFAAFVEATKYVTEAERDPAGGFGLVGDKVVQKRTFNWRNPGFAQTDEHPVVGVSWDDAEVFARWVAEQSGAPSVTLPSEAQYEWAARGALAAPPAAPDGWFRDTRPRGTRPVGQKPANALGLFDLAGNVSVWCLDAYAPYPPDLAFNPVASAAPSDTAPLQRVLRGGSFLDEAARGRAAARGHDLPGRSGPDRGIRLVTRVASTVVAPAAPLSVAPPTLAPPSARPSAAADTGRISPPPPKERSPLLPIFFLLGPALGAGAIFMAIRRSSKKTPKAPD